ncbi:MAG: hypothetical protein Kow00128_21750 [Deltaproteobacteria bacterium]
MRRRDGFTLIEVVIVIAVIAILASMAVPYAANIINQSREETTRKEMEEIFRTIGGDPAVPTPGFVGDMGRLPAGLAQLNVRGGQPLGGTGTLGVKIGWFGPYMNAGFDPNGYLNDGWGTPYAYSNPGAGQIRSTGRDRTMGTADDLIYPPAPVNINGRLLVNLYVWSPNPPPGQFVLNPQPAAYPGMTAQVSFRFSNNGVEGTAAANTPPLSPPYSFVNFHSGLHAVTAVCTLPPDPPVSGQAVVRVPGNNQQAQLDLYLR